MMDELFSLSLFFFSFFIVRHAHASAGAGYAAVALGSHTSVLSAVQTPHRHSTDDLHPSPVRHAPLRGDSEQLPLSRHLLRDIVSIARVIADSRCSLKRLDCRLKRLYKTANLTYALPLHRATPYVFGVGLGVLLHHFGKNVRIHKVNVSRCRAETNLTSISTLQVFVILGWLIATVLGLWSLFSPWHMARRDYVYDAEEAAHYAVIGPLLWAAALCWSIFACFTGHGGLFNP